MRSLRLIRTRRAPVSGRLPNAETQDGGVIIEAALSIALLLAVFSSVINVAGAMMRYQEFLTVVEPLTLEFARDDGRYSGSTEILSNRIEAALAARGLLVQHADGDPAVSVAISQKPYRPDGDPQSCAYPAPCMVRVSVQANLVGGFWQWALGQRVTTVSIPAIYEELQPT